MSNELHVIFGTGPMGCWTARALRSQGHRVRAVNLTGQRPELVPADVEMARADVMDIQQAIEAGRDASVIYQGARPPYHLWHRFFPPMQAAVLDAARAAGAIYVSIENLYMYDSSTTITEDSPTRPASKKGELRLKMAEAVMAAHERGEVRAAILRSSDYYGPGVLRSALGERVFGNLVAGRKAQISGSRAVQHSFAYIEDAGLAAAALGTDDNALGKVWLAPHAAPATQGEMVAEACRVLGTEMMVSEVSPFLMRLGGLFNADARASVEMMYQFTAPFVVDSSRIENEFNLAPTPIPQAIERTVAWYRDRIAGAFG